MNFILERMKAVVALAVPSVATVLIAAFEKGFGFDLPASWELLIMSAITGLLVHQTPNKAS